MAPSLKVSRDQIGFALSLLVIAAMAFVAALGFRSVLNGWSFAIAAGLAAGGSTVIVAVAARFRLVLGESVAASAGGFVLLGAVAVGGLPLPGAFADFARGITSGWADILSSSPPADITPEFRALPFAISWIAAAFGGELVRHTRRFGLPAIGPIAMWALSLLFTTEDRGLAIAQGVAMLTGTLLLVTVATHLREPVDEGAVTTPTPTRVRRVASLLAVTVFIATVLVAPILGPRMPLADANDRFDLRRYQEPPFDPLAVPSPLAQVKSQLKEENKDDVMFTVTSDTEIERFPVATLTDYNGVVWTVANEEEAPAAEFIPVDTVLPELEESAPPDDAESVSMTVEINEMSGVWLPTAGVPTNLRYDGELAGGADDQEDEEEEEEVVRDSDLETRMNRSTGTLALPAGLREGLTYDVASVQPSIPDDESLLTQASATPLGDAEEFDLIPPQVWNFAGDVTEGITSEWAQVAAISEAFAEGFYDSTELEPPGHSWQRLAEMFEEPERLIGYEEQYAAAAGVMARRANLPVRVVVGYHIQDHSGGEGTSSRWEDGTLEVTGNDISAWVEVRLDGYGWVPIDVTPDRTREPQEQERGRTYIDVVVPDPPPPPPEPPEVQQPEQDTDEADEIVVDLDASTTVGQRLETWAMVASVGFGGPVSLLVLVALLVVAWKALRGRRRRRAEAVSRRIGGAWAETVERCYDAGVVPPRRATPNEVITAWSVEPVSPLGAFEPDLRNLADSVDRSVYAVSGASAEHAEAAWSSSDRVVHGLRSERSLWRRLWMRVNPRSLFLREDGGRG